ncbi:MAG: NAD(P)H-binding protein [Nocardioides sp.]
MGASGELGRYLVRHCLNRGDRVVGVCRQQSVVKLAEFGELITVVTGRTDDRDVFARAVIECDAVLTVLVPWSVQRQRMPAGTWSPTWGRARESESCDTRGGSGTSTTTRRGGRTASSNSGGTVGPRRSAWGWACSVSVASSTSWQSDCPDFRRSTSPNPRSSFERTPHSPISGSARRSCPQRLTRQLVRRITKEAP